MKTVTSAPLTATVFAAMTILLYGCMAYDAASTGAGTTVISTTADFVTLPSGGGDDSKDKAPK